jgi:hypothetical protein
MQTQTTRALLDTASPGPDALDRIPGGHWWYHQMTLTQDRSTPGQFASRPQSRIAATPVSVGSPIQKEAPGMHAQERAYVATNTPACRLLDGSR